jgi:tetratricopeptide (TPR) repeat protein
LWDFGDPEGTEADFRQLLPEAEVSGDPEYHLQLLTQIARTLGLQRRFAEAHGVLDEVEPQLSEAVPIAHIRYLLERGRTFRSGGYPDKALPLFLEAWGRGQVASADFFSVDAAHMLAMVETGQAGLEWNMKAIRLAEASEQERARGWLGSLYNNTGWSFHEIGDYEKALDLFEEALAFRLQQGNPENIRIARWCVARCYRSLGRLEQALEIQRALLAEAQEAGQPAGYTNEELGELMLALGQAKQARPYFKAAFEQLSQDPWLVDNEPERLARLKKLGQAGQ